LIERKGCCEFLDDVRGVREEIVGKGEIGEMSVLFKCVNERVNFTFGELVGWSEGGETTVILCYTLDLD